MSPEQLQVRDDETDFYGKEYWLGHQSQDLGFPDIHARARADLTERNLHWLKALLKYRLPATKVWELGCSHGSFVALMRQAGYDASGVEMSPWVVEFGKQTFGAPIFVGPIESLDVPPGSLDVIALMDVMEHLPAPVDTMQHCLSLLKPDGLLLIQTPQFRPGMNYAELVNSKGAFIDQLKADEHLYLFTEQSATRLFKQLGADHIQFEPAIFAHYDMFFAVSRVPLHTNSTEQIYSALQTTPNGRMALAMLDLRERELKLSQQLIELDSDRTQRGTQIDLLTEMLKESEADRAARAVQINTLVEALGVSEADRAARAVQIDALAQALNTSEADRAARAVQIATLTEMLQASEVDRTSRAEQISTLTTMVKASQTDLAAQAAKIETLTQALMVSGSAQGQHSAQLETLSRALHESDVDRTARAEQIASLTEMLSASEADRAARATQIDTLSHSLLTVEAESTARAEQIEVLTNLLRVSDADRIARAEQISTLTGMLRESDSDRTVRNQQIETLTNMVHALEADRTADALQLASLNTMLNESDVDRNARAEQIQTLTNLLHQADAERAALSAQIEALAAALGQAETVRREQDIHLASVLANVRALFARRRIRSLSKLGNLPEMTALAAHVESANSKAPKIIAVDLTPILPGGENGGAKIFVLELLRHLAAMAPKTEFVLLTQAASHEELAALDKPNMRRVMVIGPLTADDLRPRLKGVAARVLPHLPGRLSRLVSRVGSRVNHTLKRGSSSAMLREMGADLLFCPFTAPTYFEPGIPTVCTIYDLQYKTYPEFFSPEDVAHRDHTFVQACRRATVLAAISDYSRDSAAMHGQIEPARLRTIHLRMAQRIGPKARQRKAVLARLGLTPQRYLIYPANFWKHKNHEMLLAAFGMACHNIGLASDIKLVCTGAPGPRQEWLIDAARAMNLGDRVLFPGYLPNEELSSLIANCSGVVFPSLYEGFGLPVIEAMAAGVPVACSNTSSLPEVAADAAILFDPRVPDQIASAIVSLVSDDALRKRLIQAGTLRAEEFSDGNRMAREYWDFFQYALVNARHENLVTGIHADGWAGPGINIQTAPVAGATSLEVEVSVPEWHPAPEVTIQAYRAGKEEGAPLNLLRGTDAVLKLPLSQAASYYELRLTPIFVPAESGMGEDRRELSVILRRCSILTDNSDPVELFPEQVTV